jgi:hypothetical protein
LMHFPTDFGPESGVGFRSSSATALRQAPMAERLVVLPPEIRGADVMSLLFQPAPPPCVKCGTTTVIAPVFEEGQRVFVVRCPECGHSGTYSLNYGALRKW